MEITVETIFEIDKVLADCASFREIEIHIPRLARLVLDADATYLAYYDSEEELVHFPVLEEEMVNTPIFGRAFKGPDGPSFTVIRTCLPVVVNTRAGQTLYSEDLAYEQFGQKDRVTYSQLHIPLWLTRSKVNRPDCVLSIQSYKEAIYDEDAEKLGLWLAHQIEKRCQLIYAQGNTDIWASFSTATIIKRSICSQNWGVTPELFVTLTKLFNRESAILDSEVIGLILCCLSSPNANPELVERIADSLQPRHIEVAACLAIGLSRPQICLFLDITTNTLNNYLKRIYMNQVFTCQKDFQPAWRELQYLYWAIYSVRISLKIAS